MNAKTNANKVWKIVSKQKAVIAILALMIMMLFFDTTFYTMYNWLDMLRSTAILEIVAFVDEAGKIFSDGVACPLN